jgi:PBSX family phage terminase large subunit
MVSQVQIDLKLWGAQHDFVFSDAKNAALFGGVGSGKSYAGAVRGMLAANGTIGNQSVPVPNVGVVTAATYNMLRDATIRSYHEIMGPLGVIVGHNKSNHITTLTNGSEIIFRSATDPETLRGPSILWWHADEAALYGPTVWRIMIARLRQYGKRGYAWPTTTPKGRNWIWKEFIQARRPDFLYWRVKTADNPFIDPEYYESLKRSYGGDFALQELDGEFIAFEGLIYPEFRRELHVVTAVPDQFTSTVAGVDWGFANPGVILPFGIDGDGRAWQVGEYYQRQRRIEEWVEVAKQARQTWGIKTFFCDPSEPDYIKAFRDAGLPAQAADNSVNSGLQRVKNRLVVQKDGKPRLMVRRDAVYTISEYESYQWAENRFGMRDMPVKANDHAMDATRYAVMGLDAGQKPLSVEASRYA